MLGRREGRGGSEFAVHVVVRDRYFPATSFDEKPPRFEAKFSDLGQIEIGFESLHLV